MNQTDDSRPTGKNASETKDRLGLSQSNYNKIASMFEELDAIAPKRPNFVAKGEVGLPLSKLQSPEQKPQHSSACKSAQNASPKPPAIPVPGCAAKAATPQTGVAASQTGVAASQTDVAASQTDADASARKPMQTDAVGAAAAAKRNDNAAAETENSGGNPLDDIGEDETLDMPITSDLYKLLSGNAGSAPEQTPTDDGETDEETEDAETETEEEMLERMRAETCKGIGGLGDGSDKTVSHDKLPMGYIVKNRYKIDGILGSGGFGVVYSARDLKNNNRIVAVKTLRHKIDDYETAALRFKREIEICEKLRNPHIIRILAHGTTGDDAPQGGVDADTLYYVMEFAEGKTLDDYIERREKFTFYDVKMLMLQVLDGLAEAHRDNIVHRDLKPANICLKQLSPDTREFSVKLLDFGIAKAIGGDDDSGQKLTQTGAWMGSPAYMSPEQLKGLSPTPASDMFSIGLIMIEMLTGAQAVNASSAMDAAMTILSADPLDDDEWYWLRDTAIWPVIEKCIQKDPTKRYQNADECIEALRGLDDNRLKNEFISSKMRKRPRSAASQITPTSEGSQTLITQSAAENKHANINTILIVFIIVGIFACVMIFVVKMIVDDTQDQSVAPIEQLSERDRILTRGAAMGAMQGALPLMRMNVTVSSMPSGASIYRESDNGLIGRTPMAISVVPSYSPWNLRLEAPGYVAYPFIMNVVMPTAVNLNMQPDMHFDPNDQNDRPAQGQNGAKALAALSDTAPNAAQDNQKIDKESIKIAKEKDSEKENSISDKSAVAEKSNKSAAAEKSNKSAAAEKPNKSAASEKSKSKSASKNASNGITDWKVETIIKQREEAEILSDKKSFKIN